MPVSLSLSNSHLTAALSGELDHHSIRPIREDIDSAISDHHPASLALDFHDVTFMDSSGIGLILGRCKLMGGIGGTTSIQNPPPHIKRVLRLSGIDRIAKIQNNPQRKEISQ